MIRLKPIITIVRPGLISYLDGLHLQSILTQQANEPFQNFRNFLVLQEFHPVYTIGIRTKGYTLEDELKLTKLGAEFHRTNRGGLITFHGPGQLVAYPLLHLKQFIPSMRWFVSSLESMVIECCKHMGVSDATTTKDTGIWVNNRKICAIGIHGSRYVTTHGIALNCNNDLSWFDHIVPCGIEGKGVTSLTQELGRNLTTSEAAKVLLKRFSEVFNCDTVEINKQQYEDLKQKLKIK